MRAKTTSRVTRAAKGSVDPVYGKKGTGWATDPERAAKNAVYKRTTASSTGEDTFGCLMWIVVIAVMAMLWQFISDVF